MSGFLVGAIDFDLHSGTDKTLTHRLYERLRGAILAGALPPGYRLPSSRELARELNVSRNTVSFVVDQLAMEGYVDVAQGRRPTITAVSKTRLVFGRET
ncbi:MAG TPA: winged helix-turn-helix domain-containing protein, partial [Bradyrhizobium sp.]